MKSKKRPAQSARRAAGNGGRASDGEKQEHILSAAQSLFLRYGVRRTSMEDVAREAGIAKGTIYLSFESKDVLFAALAEKVSVDALARGRQAMDAHTSDVDGFVAFLDAVIGAPNRLLAESPHAAELLDSKKEFAAPALAAFRANINAVLREQLRHLGISNNDAPGMLVAAAHGLLKTGHLAEALYRRRLASIVAVILAGLRSR